MTQNGAELATRMQWLSDEESALECTMQSAIGHLTQTSAAERDDETIKSYSNTVHKGLLAKRNSLEEKIERALQLEQLVLEIERMDEMDEMNDARSEVSTQESLSSMDASFCSSFDSHCSVNGLSDDETIEVGDVEGDQQPQQEEKKPSRRMKSKAETTREEICIKQLLVQAALLIQEMEMEGVEDSMDKAVELLNMAITDAKNAELHVLEAKAMQLLGSVFSKCQVRQQAAGPMFELAASTFAAHGENADTVSCVLEAAQLYYSLGEMERAIRCYQHHLEYDKSGMLADRLVFLLLEWSDTPLS